MPAFKFPKSNNGSFTKTGNPSSQSIGSVEKFTKKSATLSSSLLDKSDIDISSSTPEVSFSDSFASSAGVSAFEALTNISSQRPEIISLLPFQPIYEDSGDITTSGRLFDSLIEYMRVLDKNSIELVSGDFKELIKSQNKIVNDQTVKLRRILQSFYEVYRSLSKVRRALTLTNEYYDFSPSAFVNRNIKNDGDVDKEFLSLYASKMPENLNIKSVIKRLRFMDSEVDEKSSTSAFVFLVSEVRRLLNSHSYEISLNKRDFLEGFKISDSSPDRVFYKFKENRTNLLGFRNTIIDTADFTNIANFEVSENLQELKGQIEAVAKEFEELGLITAAEDLSDFQIENIEINSNYIRLNSLVQDSLVPYFLFSNEYFSKRITKIGGITSILKSLSKEVRFSKKFSVEMMGSFETEGIENFRYINSIFGDLNQNVDLYNKVDMKPNSIMELAQIPLDAAGSSKVILLEQSPDKWPKSVFAGGDYYFDPELLINFTNTNKISAIKQLKSEAPDVTIRSRIIALSGRIDRTTNDFFKCATEMGLLVTKDEKVFDGEKPSIFSANPEKYLENIWNAIKNNIAISKNEKIGFKNPGIAAKSMIAYAGNGDAQSASMMARIYISVLSDVYEQEIENLKNINRVLISGFSALSNSSSIPNDLRNALMTIAYGTLQAAGGSFVVDVYDSGKVASAINSEEIESVILQEVLASQGIGKDVRNTSDYLLGKYKDVGVIPCFFDTIADLGSALRNDSLYKKIVEILKDLKKTLENYAVNSATGETFAGAARTKFSDVTINSALALMFWNICRMVNLASPYIIRHSAIGSYLGAFAPTETSGLIDSTSAAFDYLADIGLLSKNPSGRHAVSIFVNVGEVNEYSYTFIKSSLSQEMQLETMGILTVLNTLQVLNKNIANSKEIFEKLDAADYANLLFYLGDPNKLSFFLKERQLTLAMSNIEDIYQSFQNFSKDVDKSPEDSEIFFTKYYDKLSHSDKMVASLKKLFSSQEFKASKGYNKKIISVGLAQDLLKNTLPPYDFKKQNDIIRLSIYKIDNLNSDIIYKPKSYLFEASRYPSRVYSDYKYDLDSLQSIPTRNYSVTPDARAIDKGESSYWNDISNSFNDEYSFLSQEEKEEIIENHAMSLLLENYIRITTGLVINETTFNLSPDEVEALLNELDVKSNSEQFVKSSTNKLLNKNSPGNNKNPSPKVSSPIKLNGIVSKGISKVSANLVKAITIPTSTLFKYLMQPKKFDRVFNIMFDPEFEVDVKKTRSTASGDKALNRLINEGKIILKEARGLSTFLPETKQRYLDVDKTAEDTTIESFFVVMESYDDKKNLRNASSSLSKFPPSLVSKIMGTSIASEVDSLKKKKNSSFAISEKIAALDIGGLKRKL